MKHQALFLRKMKIKKNIKVSSAASLLSSLKDKRHGKCVCVCSNPRNDVP